MSFEAELQVALKAVAVAARVCQSVQSRITRESIEKERPQPQYDRGLRLPGGDLPDPGDAFPGDEIVGEEEAEALKAPDNARHMGDLQSLSSEGRHRRQRGRSLPRWIDRGSGQVAATVLDAPT